MQMGSLYYENLYKMHDEILGTKQMESARLQERLAKQNQLENQYEGLQELPALSSFLSICEAQEGLLGDQSTDPLNADRPNNATPKTRDGFERMRRSVVKYAPHTRTPFQHNAHTWSIFPRTCQQTLRESGAGWPWTHWIRVAGSEATIKGSFTRPTLQPVPGLSGSSTLQAHLQGPIKRSWMPITGTIWPRRSSYPRPAGMQAPLALGGAWLHVRMCTQTCTQTCTHIHTHTH